MTCPDIERLIDLTVDGGRDLRTEAHVGECAQCRATVRLLREAQASYSTELPVSEAFVERSVETVMSGLEPSALSAPAPSIWDLVSMALLGVATVLFVAFGTGSLGGTRLPALIALTLLAGALAAIWEYREGPRSVSA